MLRQEPTVADAFLDVPLTEVETAAMAMIIATVGRVAARLEAKLDLLIVNKFGKQEAGGGRFRYVISTALSLEMPVLVGLNAANHEAFVAFTGDLAARLDPEAKALFDWMSMHLQAPDFVF